MTARYDRDVPGTQADYDALQDDIQAGVHNGARIQEFSVSRLGSVVVAVLTYMDNGLGDGTPPPPNAVLYFEGTINTGPHV